MRLPKSHVSHTSLKVLLCTASKTGMLGERVQSNFGSREHLKLA